MKTQLTTTLSTLPVTEWEDGIPRVLDTDLGAWLGYKNPNHIRELLKGKKGTDHLAVMEEFGLVTQVAVPYTCGKGRVGETTSYHLTRDQAVYITSQCGTPKARALTVFVVKVFGKFLDGKLIAKDKQTAHELKLALAKVQVLEAKTKEAPIPDGWMTARQIAEMYFNDRKLDIKKFGKFLCAAARALEFSVSPFKHEGTIKCIYSVEFAREVNRLCIKGNHPLVPHEAAFYAGLQKEAGSALTDE